MAKGKNKTATAGSTRGRLLNRARRAKGLSQSDLASKLDVGKSAVSGWESGAKTPNDRLIPKYAAALSLTPDQLLDILEKP